MDWCKTCLIYFIITLYSVGRIEINAVRIIAPPYMNHEIVLRPGYHRQMNLSEQDARDVAQMMMKKNFSILMEFQQQLSTRGTLFAVYNGMTKLLEFQSDGPKGELKATWRRVASLSNLNIQNIELDDDAWHQIIYEIHGDYLSLTVDCIESGYSGEYPEIDFSLFNRTNKPTQVWVSQRDYNQSLLVGKLKQFKVQSGSFYKEICKPSVLDPSVGTPVVTYTENVRQENEAASGSMADLIARVKKLEDELKKYNVALKTEDVTTTTVEPHPSVGVCPDCYEYLRYKANYLESELKRWREHVEKVEKSLQQIMLIQRGCRVDSNFVDNGVSWLINCTECICNLGKTICRPLGCQKLTCKKPLMVADECCPICGRSCQYKKKIIEHGESVWSEPCVRCRCNDGALTCSFERSQCPALNCTLANQIVPENQCCPICVDEDFCHTRPCHKDATCVKKKHGRECNCNAGFFGDGEEVCFDIDECKWDPAIAEQLGGCGSGSRCINTPGNFQCECLPGYMKINNRTCLDVIIL